MDTELELTEAFDNHKEYMNLEKFLKFAEQYLEGGVENGAQLIDQVGRGMMYSFGCGRVTGGIFPPPQKMCPPCMFVLLYVCATICGYVCAVRSSSEGEKMRKKMLRGD